MTTLTEFISADQHIDILSQFRALPTIEAQSTMLFSFLDEFQAQSSLVVRHKILIAVIHFLELLAPKLSPADLHSILTIYQEKGIVSDNWVVMPEPPVQHIQALSQALRQQARHLLEAAVLNHCALPEITAQHHTAQIGPITLTAPVRLDLGMGGISDIPPYCLEQPGNCLNVPIQLNGQAPIQVQIESIPAPRVVLKSIDQRKQFIPESFSSTQDCPPELRIHLETLRFFLQEILRYESLSEFLERERQGIAITSSVSLPLGSGLGISTLLACLSIQALGLKFQLALDPHEFFSIGPYLEHKAQIGGGWEDVSALFPGFKLLQTSPAHPFTPTITPLIVTPDFIRKLQASLCLLYTHLPKVTDIDFPALLERYTLGDPDILNQIDRTMALNETVHAAIQAEDIIALGEAFSAQWENWKQLTNGQCTNPAIDALFTDIQPFVHGARLNGAGQGGFLSVVVDPDHRTEIFEKHRSIFQERTTSYSWEPVL
ncbi:MAG: hypothetical protein JXB38_07060 [Anaerolineales bacterium]|nr:hypothetical protein [Anaerolineales bacterium]